jgi:chromosome segregation ATPase
MPPATIQRVQIAMYRLQSQAGVLDRATQRLDQARATCSQAEEQQKMFTAQIEQAEARARDAQNPAEQKAAEQMVSNFKSAVETFAAQETQCQADRVDAENQFHIEQAKMNQLEDQLDKLDQQLAGYAPK